MTENQEKDTGHDYDGIRELDNSLPKWWLGILYGTMAFSALYIGYYWIGPGQDLLAEYHHEHTFYENNAMMKAAQRKLPTLAELKAVMGDQTAVQKGRGIFEVRCLSCHGSRGEGGIGPNLTDDFWLHGGKFTEVAATISAGVPDKGMPAWGPVLEDNELRAVAAYVRTLRGTNPPGAKAAQGDRVARTQED